MITEISKIRNTAWLENVIDNLQDFKTKLPLRDLLRESLYYPACGLNGTPVKYLGGNVISFVYADYSLTLPRYKRNLLGTGPDDGFKGFNCLYEGEVGLSEIVPHGWGPPILPTSRDDIERIKAQERRARPFGHWSLWQKEHPSVNGANYFSFFYLGGEMNAVYQGLYNRLAIKPKILAIIQPGAIGGEWEGVESNDSFKKIVSANPEGLPEYLLNGGYGDSNRYATPCWHEYEGEPLAQLDERHARLWRLGMQK